LVSGRRPAATSAAGPAAACRGSAARRTPWSSRSSATIGGSDVDREAAVREAADGVGADEPVAEDLPGVRERRVEHGPAGGVAGPVDHRPTVNA
jgi:hypothetical protein